MKFATHLLYYLEVISWARSAVTDPASLPPPKELPIYRENPPCVMQEILKCYSQIASMKMNCQMSKIKTYFDTPTKVTQWRPPLPTAVYYTWWDHVEPTFTETLYQQVVANSKNSWIEENVAVSPLGLWMGFAVLSMGVGGEIKREILGALRESAVRVPKHYRTLVNALGNKNRGSLKVFTKYFLDNEYKLESPFARRIHDYTVKFEQTKFIKDLEGSINKINTAVVEEIPEFPQDAVNTDLVNKDTILLLLDIVYFNGKFPFPNNMRFNDKFKTSEERFSQATYMSQSGHYYYYKENTRDEYKMMEIIFASEAGKPSPISLIVVLPDKLDGLHNVVQRITKDNTWLISFLESSTEKVLLKLTLPCFTINSNIDLNVQLSKLGIKKVFEEEFPSDVSQKNIKFSLVQQRILARFCETGEDINVADTRAKTEENTSSDSSMKTFVVDHPFVFGLIHRATKTVILIGHITNPDFIPNIPT